MSGTGSEIAQLSYVRIGVQHLAWWRRLAEVVGFAVAEDAPADELWLRMDHQRDYRIVLHASAQVGIDVLGWDVADPLKLAALGERLRSHGTRVEAVPELARARRVEELLEVRDPDGVRCELVWGGNCALRKPLPAASASRFNAGALGFGHVTMAVTDAAATLRFYMQSLGLRLSNAACMDGSSSVYSRRCNPR